MERERRPVNLQERPLPIKSEHINRGKRVVGEFNELQSISTASEKVRLRELETHSRNITAIAYRGEPFIYNFFDPDRKLLDLMPTIKTLHRQGAIGVTDISLVEKNNLFIKKHNGLSLVDIEDMEVDPKTHDLAAEDIRRINRMFRPKVFSRVPIGKKSMPFAVESLTYFASQQWTHPEIGVPRSLKKFQENITAYFDYYTDFITDFNRDPINEQTMLLILLLGAPYLTTAVSTYLPSRLNITPSSAIKLYKQRELLTPDLAHKFAWKSLEKVFIRSFKQAYRDDAFPEDLKKYQHYSEETDSAAALRLLSYMQETTTTEQQLQNKDEAQNLLEQWNKHKKDVIRELMQDPKKRIEYQVSDDHPGEKITVIKNRDTFVFVMQFADNVHLTLELDKTGKLFGVPPSLIKAYPHVEDTFIADILKPLLEKYKPKSAPVSQISAASLNPSIPEDLEIPEEVAEAEEPEEPIIKPPKRKRLTALTTVFEQDPLPPSTPLPPTVKRFVSYSEEKIRELLGPKVSRQQDIVDQALRSIRNFEQGNADSWRLRGGYSGITRIRFGDYRIFMHDQGSGNYSVSQIRRRGGAYQPRA